MSKSNEEIQLITHQILLNQHLEKIGLRDGFINTIVYDPIEKDWCIQFMHNETRYRFFLIKEGFQIVIRPLNKVEHRFTITVSEFIERVVKIIS